jgi:hypothetical protein
VNEASLPTAVEAVQLQGTGHAGLKVESFLKTFPPYQKEGDSDI